MQRLTMITAGFGRVDGPRDYRMRMSAGRYKKTALQQAAPAVVIACPKPFPLWITVAITPRHPTA